jgi:hypothetical protein
VCILCFPGCVIGVIMVIMGVTGAECLELERRRLAKGDLKLVWDQSQRGRLL